MSSGPEGRRGGHSRQPEKSTADPQRDVARHGHPSATAHPPTAALSDEWVRHLHTSYLNRFLADNQRIWTTASIFVPLSLAAFPALFSIKSPSLAQAAVLAAVSMGLLLFWFAVAERHRAFQDHYMRTIGEIERMVSADSPFQDVIWRAQTMPRSRKGLGVRSLRVKLVVAVGVGWVVVTVAVAMKWIP